MIAYFYGAAHYDAVHSQIIKNLLRAARLVYDIFL